MAFIHECAENAASITPSDTEALTPLARALYVGGAGDVAVVTTKGDDVVFSGMAAGSVLPVQCKQVKSTGTTATLILGLY